jgi:hypothetical protein
MEIVQPHVIAAVEKLILPEHVVQAAVELVGMGGIGNSQVVDAPVGNSVRSIANRLPNVRTRLVTHS